MSISIRQLHPVFVGEVEGVDLTRPLAPDVVSAIEVAMDRYAVLVFHDQRLTDDQQLAFTRRLGTIEPPVGGIIAKRTEQRLTDPEMNDLSNLGPDNKPVARDNRRRMFNLSNRLWHSDSSFKVVPAKYSLLSARVIPPEDGNTEFADMRAAYDTLDEATKAEIDDLICEHSQMFSRGLLGFADFTSEEMATFQPVRQRLVRTHPRTSRRSLFLSAHVGSIVGWLVPEARAFLRDLTEHATKPEFVYVHKWRQHDVVIWDNEQTMHRVRRYNESQPRDMRRTTTVGGGPTVEQVHSG
jgi:alpha-ketoglutarate-dependent 2,4-dichlorophenoxyacetate dioxygenase